MRLSHGCGPWPYEQPGKIVLESRRTKGIVFFWPEIILRREHKSAHQRRCSPNIFTASNVIFYESQRLQRFSCYLFTFMVKYLLHEQPAVRTSHPTLPDSRKDRSG